MWKWLAKHRLSRAGARNGPITEGELERARSVLFAVFAPYGDSIIAFKIIREFQEHHPEKRCLLAVTPHVLPYARAIVGDQVQCIAINKRKSWWKITRLVLRLYRDPPDIGFSPWSHGGESQALASYATRFFLFADFARGTQWRNHYERVREYLMLPQPVVAPRVSLPPSARSIVVAPFSTDARRSLNAEDLHQLIAWLRGQFADAQITVALLPAEVSALKGVEGVERFKFSKARRRSRQFLTLLQAADLFVGADAGPLHLADALHIRSLGLFGPTPPERVLDRDSRVLALRVPGLRGYFCEILTCRDPVCLHRIDFTGEAHRVTDLVPAGAIVRETKRCRALD